MNEQTLKFIEDQKIIAIVRVSQPEDADQVVQAIRRGGIRVIEFA